MRSPEPTHLVVGFQSRAEAERFLKEFRERLAKFGLELHAEKTRLIEFGRFAVHNRKRQGEGKPETFTFLGFTHYCGKRRKDGAFIVWRETSKKRLVAKLKAIKLELKHRRHEPIASVGAWLPKVTTGYYQYHAVPGNLPRLQLFRWRSDGKELFYVALDRKLMAVPVKTGAAFEAETPRALFETTLPTTLRQAYSATPDGQRFFLAAPVEAATSPITIVENWTAALKK